MAHYEAVAHAYIEGLRAWLADGGDPHQIASSTILSSAALIRPSTNNLSRWMIRQRPN
ncbi:MAG: hypothetical protein R3C44_04335 [Chloroflexota bacterium]